MKNTSQQYLNSEAHGYLMEPKPASFCSKTWSASAPSSSGTSKRKPQTARQNLKQLCNTIAKATSRNYGWEFISEQQYERYLELFRQGRKHLMNTAPLLQSWLSPS